jgi:hypothetical protein
MKPQTMKSASIAALSGRVVSKLKRHTGNPRHWSVLWVASCVLILGMLPVRGVPTSLVMQSFNSTLPSVDLQFDLHDGSGIHTNPTGPMTISLDPNAVGTVTTAKGQHIISFGYLVRMPLFTTLFGPDFQDVGTYFEVSESTENPLTFSGEGKTKTGVVSLTINNYWNCTVTNAARADGGTTALIVPGPATWTTPGLQLTFPASTTGVPYDQVFSNITANGSAVLAAAPAPEVLPMTSFSGTIPSINLMIDDGSGPQPHETGPLTLSLDPRVGGALTSAGGLQTISFGFQVNSPLFLALFGTNFDSGTYVESSTSTGNPFTFAGNGKTTRGVASIDINNYWNCQSSAARLVPGPATWNTATMQLTFPGTTTGMPYDQVFPNLTASGAAEFAAPAPVVLAISSFSGTVPSVELKIKDGTGEHTVLTGPIQLGLDTNAIGTVQSGAGLQTISFGYTVSVPGLEPVLGAPFLDTGSYVETSTSTNNPFIFSGRGVAKNSGVVSIDINNRWNSQSQNKAIAPGPATWNTATMGLVFPKELTGTDSDQTFSNLTVSGAAMFIPAPAPVELAMSGFSGTIPSVTLQVDLHDGPGPQTVTTGPMSLMLDHDVGGLVTSANGLQTLSFGYMVNVPGLMPLLGTDSVQHGTYVETSTSTGNPFVFSGRGVTKSGVASIDINNYWNSQKSSTAIAPGPATWHTSTMELIFPASTTGMPADQVFSNLEVIDGMAMFVEQPRPVAVAYSLSADGFTVTYQNLDPSKLYTLYRGLTPVEFPTQVGTAFTGVPGMVLTDSNPPPAGAFYMLRGK